MMNTSEKSACCAGGRHPSRQGDGLATRVATGTGSPRRHTFDHAYGESIRRHGLTPAEARVALALLDEDEPASPALSMNLQPSTIKTHVARLHEKLGVNSRTALLRVLMGQANVRD